jgi:hypothetical protein
MCSTQKISLGHRFIKTVPLAGKTHTEEVGGGSFSQEIESANPAQLS